MAFTPVTVNGNLETLIGGTPNLGRIWFKLNRADWNADGDIFAPEFAEAIADAGGAFAVALQSTTGLTGGAFYSAILRYLDPLDGQVKEYTLASFALPPGGPYQLTDLLSVPVVEPVPADILALATASALAAANSATLAQAAALTTAGVKSFGAVGDWNGSTGTDDTTAINAALAWLAAADHRVLHFPTGWYRYTGAANIDFGGRFGQRIKMDGAISFGTSNQIAWTFSNMKHAQIELNARGGGLVGDFSVRVPGTGTTALKVHKVTGVDIVAQSIGYAGRLLHCTAEGALSSDRCVDMNIKCYSNGRPGAGFVRTGQVLYADSNAAASVGAFGSFQWRGEGSVYGPVFERLNDITIPNIEAGSFLTAGMEMRGCVKVRGVTVYLGESDTASPDVPLLRMITEAGGIKCNDIEFGQLYVLRSGTANAVYADDFASSRSGLRINHLNAEDCAYALELDTMPEAWVGTINVLNCVGAVMTTGACGNVRVGLEVGNAVTGTVVDISDTSMTGWLRLTGRIVGGVASFPLIDLGTANNRVELSDLHLESSVATELVTIGNAGANRIRHRGGSMTIGGSTVAYTAGRRPEYISGIRGYQTISCGSATILSGNTGVAVTHGLEETPQVAFMSPTDIELDTARITAHNATTFTVTVAAAVTANRTFYWSASAEILRGDVDA